MNNQNHTPCTPFNIPNPLTQDRQEQQGDTFLLVARVFQFATVCVILIAAFLALSSVVSMTTFTILTAVMSTSAAATLIEEIDKRSR
jgi:hypothetical protein